MDKNCRNKKERIMKYVFFLLISFVTGIVVSEIFNYSAFKLLDIIIALVLVVLFLYLIVTIFCIFIIENKISRCIIILLIILLIICRSMYKFNVLEIFPIVLITVVFVALNTIVFVQRHNTSRSSTKGLNNGGFLSKRLGYEIINIPVWLCILVVQINTVFLFADLVLLENCSLEIGIELSDDVILTIVMGYVAIVSILISFHQKSVSSYIELTTKERINWLNRLKKNFVDFRLAYESKSSSVEEEKIKEEKIKECVNLFHMYLNPYETEETEKNEKLILMAIDYYARKDKYYIGKSSCKKEENYIIEMYNGEKNEKYNLKEMDKLEKAFAIFFKQEWEKIKEESSSNFFRKIENQETESPNN